MIDLQWTNHDHHHCVKRWLAAGDSLGYSFAQVNDIYSFFHIIMWWAYLNKWLVHKQMYRIWVNLNKLWMVNVHAYMYMYVYVRVYATIVCNACFVFTGVAIGVKAATHTTGFHNSLLQRLCLFINSIQYICYNVQFINICLYMYVQFIMQLIQ